jgi:hypothetical protein
MLAFLLAAVAVLQGSLPYLSHLEICHCCQDPFPPFIIHQLSPLVLRQGVHSLAAALTQHRHRPARGRVAQLLTISTALSSNHATAGESFC